MDAHSYTLREAAAHMTAFNTATGEREFNGAKFYGRPFLDRLREAAQRGSYDDRTVDVALMTRESEGGMLFMGTVKFWVDAGGCFFTHERLRWIDGSDTVAKDVWDEVEFRMSRGMNKPFELYGREWHYAIGVK